MKNNRTNRNKLCSFVAVFVFVFAVATMPISVWADEPSSAQAKQFYERGLGAKNKGDMPAAAAEFRKAADLDSRFTLAHIEYIDTLLTCGRNTKACPGVPSMMEAFEDYNKRQEKDPTLEGPWLLSLAFTKQRGWQKAMGQACSLEPEITQYMIGKAMSESDPRLILEYAHSFRLYAPDAHIKVLESVVTRFLKRPEAVQALVNMAAEAATVQEQMERLERAHEYATKNRIEAENGEQDLEGFTSYTRGMEELFQLYVARDARKALEFAEAMSHFSPESQEWNQKLRLQRLIVEANSLIAAGKFQECRELLSKIEGEREPSSLARSKMVQSGPRTAARSGMQKPNLVDKQAETRIKLPDMGNERIAVQLLSAEIADGLGSSDEAYQIALNANGKSPSEPVRAALLRYGGKLGKSPQQVEIDFWESLSKAGGKYHTKAFTADGRLKTFELATYDGKKVNLADLRGKVVLITFWFPTCPTCVAEFPFFERVVRKYRAQNDKFVLLAVNFIPSQDHSVPGLLKQGNYSFTALGIPTPTWAGETYGVFAGPTNFLLDQNGVYVGSPYVHSAEEQKRLESMIDMLLARTPTP